MNLFMRVKQALIANKDIATTLAEAEGKAGYSEEYLLSIGLDKADLKKLERKGLALRGYASNGKGHRVRWFLVITAQQTGDAS